MHNIITTTYNLNNAPTQKSFELIPGGSIVKVLLKIIAVNLCQLTDHIYLVR